MNIRIAIVDDQAQARELLRQDLLVRVPDGASVACFDGGEAFLSGFTPGDDALVFLDICMEGMNGIEVAQRVRKRSARCLIVFLTSSKEYAFDAFPVHPFDYLVKPYSACPWEVTATICPCGRRMVWRGRWISTSCSLSSISRIAPEST